MVYQVTKLGIYRLGLRTIKVRIKNTGNTRATFYVGACIAKSISGSGCSAYPTGTGGVDWFEFYPYRSVTLDPGQTSDYITFNFNDSILSAGTWYVLVKVWQSTGGSYTSYFINSDTGAYEGQKTVTGLQNCLVAGTASFTVQQVISAQIVEISVT